MTQATEVPAALRIAVPADDLCLRFINTRYWRGMAEPTEELREPSDLQRWLQAEAGLPPESVRQAGDAFADALRLRETLFRLFVALAAGKPGAAADVAALNAALATVPARTCITLSAPSGWLVPELRPAALLAPVLWSAGDLALGPRAGRVRQCANPACQWLFLDDSKSGNRRWCSMSACGNRAKAHRHYLKQKGQLAAG
ncbi:MAG TPA: ABATE domain-containing protein [Acetobacteraceae bacterium]|nr:ABATE domain-containing protein [Acetobacteraceae bacterium]